MKLRDDVNEDDIPVVWYKCDYCGEEYNICPAPAEEDQHLYNGCTISPCESYDPKKDVDVLFMDDRDLADHADKVGVVDIKMLGKRRKFQSGTKFEDLEPASGEKK